MGHRYPLTKLAFRNADVTASENGSGVDVWDFDNGRFLAVLQATEDSGTATLDAKLQTSTDGGSTWVDIPSASFTQLTATGSQAIKVETAGVLVRVAITIGGSGNWDVTVRFVGAG